ncbi:tyrosine-type recombinase/integrase [Nonomuraea sp. K274]|uniref:Tyrosine-type recombinase/integrase n=1 Tax=Nonomuraea cypriaca TaxID=1187855 RepID=A0A931F1D5_9ACTN|nr:tyrosine-type recombinase/integrase [Nonomuraea cypriaca]MBF8187343.1 tyrosine-type recombinase/integrase [Nonomuraea cypriaca]
MSNVVEFNPERRTRRRTSAASRAIPVPRGAALPACLDSWRLALESANKASKTIRSYTDVATMFITYLNDNSLPCDAEGVKAEHVRAFLVRERHRTSPASADVCFRNLRVWFNWMCSDEIQERTTSSPVLKVDRPQVARKVREYIGEDEQRQLLATAGSNSFEDRRDRALMTILYDSGPRASGIMNVRYTPRDPDGNEVDLRGRRLRITLKGGDQHWLPLGSRAAQALDRYIRARSAHSRALTSPWLWLGIQGRNTAHMSPEGLRDMLTRRGELAGIRGKVHPHRYRGTAAHELLKAGASDSDVQSIMGWKTREMVDHYAGDLAAERAREVHARLSPADRI